MRPRWYCAIYGPLVLDQRVQEIGGIRVRAWTRAGAVDKAYRWHHVALSRTAVRIEAVRV